MPEDMPTPRKSLKELEKEQRQLKNKEQEKLVNSDKYMQNHFMQAEKDYLEMLHKKIDK